MLNLTYSVADQNFAKTKSLGILNLSIQLAKALASSRRLNRFTVLSNTTIRCGIPEAEAQIVDCDRVIANKLTRVFWDQWGVYQAAAATANDWLFLPKGFASFTRKPPCRLAVYIHDTMMSHYEAHYPGRMPAFESWYFKASLKNTIKQADRIFTNSEFTRSEVLRHAQSLGCPPPPVTVAGIGFEAPGAPPETKKDQIVFLASTWPHKQTALAVQYAERWQNESHYEGRLLWIGGLPEGVRLPNHQGWQQHPRLEEAAFRKIMEESRALVFFSDYEGFGMPCVEAALSQTCPVFSDIPATREVMHGMGFAFQNGDYESFANAMEKALRQSETLSCDWRETLLKIHCWENVVQTIADTLENS